MAFTGDHLLRRKCSLCRSQRFYGGTTDDVEYFTDANQFASLTTQVTYSNLPIIPRLKLLYTNDKWAKKMRYPRSLLANPWEGTRDVWEGKIMEDLRSK